MLLQHRTWFALGLCCPLLILVVPISVQAQTGTLAEPFPAPAPNAALHYQRGLLQLAALDESQKRILEVPIWEALPDAGGKSVPKDVGSLVYRARYATASATAGSRLTFCDFGTDFRQAGAATQLPHLEGIVQLGRLLTLRGAHAESQGDWETAAIIYFDGLRMGRHLNNQQTLLESLAGIEILRNNYFALARWAVRCPPRPLVARAFGLLEAMQGDLVSPAQIVARESSILALEFRQIEEAFPDGDWAEIILLSVGEGPSGDKKKDETRAIALSMERGVPRSVFDNAKQFREYVNQLSATMHRFTEALSVCMTLPVPARLERAQSLRKKYGSLIRLLTADALLDPVEVGKLFAEHEAELTVARLALAVSANKQNGKFPNELSLIKNRFGGAVPKDPYSGQAVNYTVSDNGQAFSLVIPGKNGLAGVDFNSRSPAPVE